MESFLPDWSSLRDNLWGSAIWSILALGAASAAACYYWIRSAGRKKHYLPLVLTDSDSYIKQVEEASASHFERPRFPWHRPIARLSAMPSNKSSRIGWNDRAIWRALLSDAVKTFRKAETHRDELHVVFGTPGQWNIALGSLLKNNHHRHVVYHWQDGVYNRIWQIDRTIKDWKAVVSGRPFLYRIFQRRLIEPKTAGSSQPIRECFVFHPGAHDIVPAVRQYRDEHLPDAAIRVYDKKLDRLDPREPGQFIQAAVEMAHALSERQDSVSTERYVFYDGPAVIAFMVGDALGDYSGCNLHLMFYVKSGANQGSYEEMLCIPDAELSSIAG